MNKYRNPAALILLAIALCFLLPGVTQPLLQIQVSASIPILGQLQFYDETQSILESIKALFASGNNFVGFLIALFSIAVPIIKAATLCAAAAIKRPALKTKLHSFVNLISKWSMADVFVVSVFMAFLATQSNDYVAAQLHPGFYYFLAYCVISIISTQLLDVRDPQSAA